MAAAVKEFPAKYGRAPHLVVVLVGDDPASVSYVTGKAKASAEVGIRNTTIRRPAETGGPSLSCLLVPPAAGMFPAQRVIPFR